MRYAWNGYDFKALFGVTARRDSDPFIAWADVKDSLEQDFKDEDGIIKDLAEPKFKPREFTMKLALIANGREDFFYKYEAFQTVVTAPGLHELYRAENNRFYQVYFKKQTNLTTLTQLDALRVGIMFDLVLGELNPLANIVRVYLVDDQDRFLTA
ncbi:hypothetical protein [Mucilaginibacter glaciei]|uniref:Uncharacterized protein n=1 Tax=Mucilaginibacter glaciei TaxID=2772109 RepID=A0A926S2V1_9SPHI|nr:hypothetical protein [Mucilaginibacter glaciei]MBD1394257.1 hypothetical protein [Mucilaginibacter glaciei]